MSEELTASSHSLGQEVGTINSMLREFRTGMSQTIQAPKAVTAEAPARPQPSPARALSGKVAFLNKRAFTMTATAMKDACEEQDISGRLSFLGIDDANRENIRKAKSIVERELPIALDRFYETVKRRRKRGNSSLPTTTCAAQKMRKSATGVPSPPVTSMRTTSAVCAKSVRYTPGSGWSRAGISAATARSSSSSFKAL
jgi:hypothetical protein